MPEIFSISIRITQNLLAIILEMFLEFLVILFNHICVIGCNDFRFLCFDSAYFTYARNFSLKLALPEHTARNHLKLKLDLMSLKLVFLIFHEFSRNL